MPAVEACPIALPAAPEPALGRDPGSASDSPASNHDFDSVMQATLAAHPKKSPAKNPPSAGPNAINGKTSPPPANAPAVAGNEPAKTTGSKAAGDTAASQKKTPASADVTTPPDPHAAADPAADTAAPLPVFLSLPLLLSGAWAEPMNLSPQTQLAQPPAAEKISAVAGPDAPAGKTETPAAGTNLDGRGNNSPASAPAPAATDTADKLSSPVKPASLPPPPDGAQKVGTAKSPTADAPAKSAGEAVAEPNSTTPAPANATPATASPAGQAQNLAAVATSSPAAGIAGTGVATTDSPMKNLQKTNEIAGSDVKVLPVGETGEARENNLPAPLLVTPARPSENSGSNLNFSFANGNSQTPVADSATGLSPVDLPSLTDARMRTVERTTDMMALHAMRLVESKSDGLSVVIKPSVGTELSLELRQHAGRVEAQATLTRGDHQFLNQHWAELQQRLEQRGIKLSPLGGETDFSAGDQSQFQQSSTAEEEAAQRASAFAEFASTDNPGGASARLAIIHDGWESWA